MVTPRSRSSLRLSRTHAYLKVPLPIFSASSSKAFVVLSSVAPAKDSKCPVVVDFPWSTCPMITRFKCGFALLLIFHSSFFYFSLNFSEFVYSVVLSIILSLCWHGCFRTHTKNIFLFVFL